MMGHVQAKDELNSAFGHLFSHVAQQHLCIKEDNLYSVNSEKGGVAEIYMMVAFGLQRVRCYRHHCLISDSRAKFLWLAIEK